MYNVFLSYRRDGGFAMARLLYEKFCQRGLNPFFDVEELKSGKFDIKLYNYIEESPNFVLILPPNSLDRCREEGDWLKLEIEHALKHEKNIIPVMMKDFVWPKELPESIASLPSYNGVKMNHEYFDACVEKLMGMLIGINSVKEKTPEKKPVTIERIENKYFIFDDEKEKRRLRTQQDLMKRFDEETYKRVVDSLDELYILDIGSNNGDFIMDRIGGSEKLRLLVGLEYDAMTVETANQRYGVDGRIEFFEQNVEADDLDDKLRRILAEMNAESFNVVNISMVMLHLKNPYRLLKTIRRYLSRGAVIIIKDIDDGYNIAYPDEHGDFARVVEICEKNETAGFRHSGRQIYTLLRHAGYTDVALEKCGLSTIGMDYDERAAFFDTYFSFIIEDLKVMMERYPNEAEYRESYEWYDKVYADLEERFQDEDFYFNLGFVLYTAKKR